MSAFAWELDRDPKHTTLWEGLALLVAFRKWMPDLGFGATVRTKSDSLSSLRMLAKGSAKSLELHSSGVGARPSFTAGQSDLPGSHTGSHESGSRLLVQVVCAEYPS